MAQPDFETRIATLEQKLEDLARVVVRQQLTIEAMVPVIGKIDLMEQVILQQNQILAGACTLFERLFPASEVNALRKLFEKPSPPDGNKEQN